MTTARSTRTGDLPPLPRPGASPADVRAALHEEYRSDFDRDYRAALAAAERTLDLAEIHDVVEHWRRRSWVTRDPDEHRRLVRRAAERLTGERPPPDEAASVTEERL